jgi:diketogulonate reductase-like aldo/keto reductase
MNETSDAAPTVALPDGSRFPALGLGTWHMGERARTRADEIAAVRLALQLGYRLIDTAEMYGEGGAEQVVGAALKSAFDDGIVRREDVTIVTKVYPHNASRAGVVAACDRSLARLGLDHVDLYLLHWQGQHPLAETVAGFERLVDAGKIRRWGVSNFDRDAMAALRRVHGGEACAANQVYYSASERGIEFDLLPWQRELGIPTMAYCPIDQGALAAEPVFAAIGARHGATAAQAALAWLLRHRDVIAIPKAVREMHLRENFEATRVRLGAQDLAEVDALFPPPDDATPLAML